MDTWLEAGRDIEFIYNACLELHTSVLNNKSAPIPPQWWPSTEKFLRRMGYRLVVRSLRHERWLEPGDTLHIEMQVDNIGVAPPYRAYKAILEIREAARRGQRITLLTQETDWNVLKWLPGCHLQSTEIIIPEKTRPGRYNLYFAIFDPYDYKPAVKLAVSGRDAQDWYSWSSLEIVEKGTLQEILTRTK